MGFFFPQLVGGRRPLGDVAGRKWYDEIKFGKGCAGAIDSVTSFGKGQMPRAFPRGDAGPFRAPGVKHQVGGRSHEPVVSPPFIGYELDLERRRQQRLAISFGATTEQRPSLVDLFHHATASGQSKSSRISGMDGDG